MFWFTLIVRFCSYVTRYQYEAESRLTGKSKIWMYFLIILTDSNTYNLQSATWSDLYYTSLLYLYVNYMNDTDKEVLFSLCIMQRSQNIRRYDSYVGSLRIYRMSRRHWFYTFLCIARCSLQLCLLATVRLDHLAARHSCTFIYPTIYSR